MNELGVKTTIKVQLFEAESCESFEKVLGAKLDQVTEFEDGYLEFVFILENGMQVDIGLFDGKLFISEPYTK